MSIKKKKAPSLASIVNNENDINVNEILLPKKNITVVEENTTKKLVITKIEKIATTIAIPVPVKDKLEEILFSERKSKKSQNDLLLEAIDLLFKDRGFPSINALMQK